jgi:hypothetical protein
LIHQIGTIDGGRGFRTGKNEFRIGGNTFYNRKNKIPMKILESKRSKIEIIAGFREIPNGDPNLDEIDDIEEACVDEDSPPPRNRQWLSC